MMQWNCLGTPHSNFRCCIKYFFCLYFLPQFLVQGQQLLAVSKKPVTGKKKLSWNGCTDYDKFINWETQIIKTVKATYSISNNVRWNNKI